MIKGIINALYDGIVTSHRLIWLAVLGDKHGPGCTWEKFHVQFQSARADGASAAHSKDFSDSEKHFGVAP